MDKIQFNRPYMCGKELDYISLANNRHQFAGDGEFTKKCQKILESYTKSQKVMLTHSCTAALEMSAILLDIKKGDEVILPSYTFVSTANAFVLRGATPVFVDIRPDTLNIDEKKIENAITNKTKAIIPVHYAGVACEMDLILDIAQRNNIAVVEDAAQGILASYKGMALGSIGDIGAYSFHETKNIISGEGGAILINNNKYIPRAEIIREKGTNRSRFFRGEVDKYTWEDIGSSYLPGEITAAFLCAQLEMSEEITKKRIAIWNNYNQRLKELENSGLLSLPKVPEYVQHNAHMYYIIVNSTKNRDEIINHLKEKNIYATFHYVPLHSSPGGEKFSRCSGSMKVTEGLSKRLIRLPLWIGLSDDQIDYIVSNLKEALEK